MMNGHDEPIIRHFRGLDDEILQERRLTRKRNLPLVTILTKRSDPHITELLKRLKDSTTVVSGVEEIRLFNADNLETTRFCFESPYTNTSTAEKKIIEENHHIRMQVMTAITGPNCRVKTVAFIPGGVNHIRYKLDYLTECWQQEVDQLCADLVNRRGSSLRYVHFATRLCTGLKWSLNIEQLLESSLEEISLPDLTEDKWRALATGLLRNETLRVVTVRYNRRNMDTFLQQGGSSTESWTKRRQSKMKTLCVSLPNDFSLEEDAEEMASILHRVSSVSTFVMEYAPAERRRDLKKLANYIRKSLALAPNVRSLHLLIPFRSQELREHILSMDRTLSCLILVSDRWSKTDLKAAQTMIRNNPELEIFGLRRQDPERGRSLWKLLLSQEITKANIVKYLEHDAADTDRSRTLSVRGRDQVNDASNGRLTEQANLYIKLSPRGLELKNTHDAEQGVDVNRESERFTTTGLSSSRHSSPFASETGAKGSVHMSGLPGTVLSAGESSSGSWFNNSRSRISEHFELGTHIGEEPGTVFATSELRQLQPLQYHHQQQQHPVRQRGPPMHFSEFSFDEIVKATENFHLEAVIGQGGFGQVYFGNLDLPGRDRGTRQVAVKDLNLEGANWERVVKSFETEVRTLGGLHHKYLVPLLGFCIHDQRRLLVYKFMPNSSLDHWIFRDGPHEDKLPWHTRMSITEGVARGVCYLHFECDPPIIHLDIKPQNILLDGRKVPKLADFGIAKLVVDTEQNLVTVTRDQGTRCYMAPEITQSKCVTTLSDVFSFGLVLIELVRGRRNSDMREVDPDSSLSFPLWAREMFRSGQYRRAYDQLKDSRVSPLIPGYNEIEAQRMLCIAIVCINEDMVKRPHMSAVLRMLESSEPVPDPSRCTPSADYN